MNNENLENNEFLEKRVKIRNLLLEKIAEYERITGRTVPRDFIVNFEKQYENSDKAYEVIEEEINALYDDKIKESEEQKALEKSQEEKEQEEQKVQEEQITEEKKYDLNELFNCRISYNTLHIHVVPVSVKEEMAEMGRKEYFEYVEKQLDDALRKIAPILQEPSNEDIDTVLAVSPTLKLSILQEMFARKGFEVGFTQDERFVNMFKTDRIGIARISREKFLQMYAQFTQAANRVTGSTNLPLDEKTAAMIVEDILKGYESDAIVDSNELLELFAISLNGYSQRYVDDATEKDNEVLKAVTKIVDDPTISAVDKKSMVSDQRSIMETTNENLAKQQNFLEEIQKSVVEAMNYGCETRNDYIAVIPLIMQMKNSKNPEEHQQIEDKLLGFKYKKQEERIENGKSVDKENVKQLVKKFEPHKSNTESEGKVNIIILSLIITFVIGMAVGICYMFYKLNVG